MISCPLSCRSRSSLAAVMSLVVVLLCGGPVVLYLNFISEEWGLLARGGFGLDGKRWFSGVVSSLFTLCAVSMMPLLFCVYIHGWVQFEFLGSQ